jgi:two-component system, NarL family, invasion response regulator UvrY
MKPSATGNPLPEPVPPFGLVLIGADASLEDVLREHFAAPAVGWRVDACASVHSAWNGVFASRSHAVLVSWPVSAIDGLEVLRRVRAHAPHMPAVLFGLPPCAATLCSALMAGAQGCLITPLRPADLPQHLGNALDGGLALCKTAADLLLEAFREMGKRARRAGLSAREQDVMLCLELHPTDKECAAALGISAATVHAHLATIYKKLGVHDRNSALRVYWSALRGGG